MFGKYHAIGCARSGAPRLIDLCTVAA